MADKHPKNATTPAAAAGGPTRPPGGDFETFAYEYDEDRKIMRIAVGIAVAFHVGLLIMKLPELVNQAPPPPEKPKVYVVQQVRFKPPPPEQKRELPKARAKKVPIPDPTPDEPEPIRLPDEIQQNLDLPESDIVFDIPEGPPPAEPEGPIQVGGDVKPPVKTFSPQPQYTEIARKARIQGVVIVQAIINKQGDVTDVKVLKPLPMGLGDAAAEAVAKWKFKPATLNGKPVDVYYNLTVNFTLQ
jgi:periplasmic protein TonB